jgi:hypothetical protein
MIKITKVPFLLPPAAAAQTWGNNILVASKHWPPTVEIVAHELVHVDQWDRYGVIGFVVEYVRGLIFWRGRGGLAGLYKYHPLEVEAHVNQEEPRYLVMARGLIAEQVEGK